jgi:hypothetical protein
MRAGRYIVFDIDFEVMERFRDQRNAVRFARWLARGRHEDHTVLVTDEARRGVIVWPEPAWFQRGAIAS